MWRLIKSDVKYNHVALLALYAIHVTVAILNAIWGGLEEHISRFILVKTALILVMVSSMNISMDVPFCFIHRITGDIFRVLAKLCAVCAAFLYFFSSPYEDWPPVVTEFLAKIFISPVGVLGLLALGFGFAVLSVFVFERRKSYAE
jgi:hypothetical protein